MRRGCGRWPSGIMRIARRRTAMRQRAGPRWPRSRRASGENNVKASEDHQILGRGISPMTLSRRTLRTAVVIGYAVVVALVIADLFTNVFAETWPDRVVVGWFLILSCGLLWLADWAGEVWPRQEHAVI